jgi:endonuclease III
VPILEPGEEERLRETSRRLNAVYDAAPLGNKPDPLDELVFIQLSIRTRQGAYNSIFEGLREACGGEWGQLRDLPREQALSILEPGGMAAIKLKRLIGQLNQIEEQFGRITLAPLRNMSTEEAEEVLVGLPGVGPKTARCVLLYSLRRPVFPVDSHCLRVMDRLGYLPGEVDRKAAHDLLQELVPIEIRHELHVNLVHHGRSLCIAGVPRCDLCPVLEHCPTGSDATKGGAKDG